MRFDAAGKGLRSPGRLFNLDFLRGVFALIVVIYHVDINHGPLPSGYVSVDFFFILSGFVLTHAYQRRGVSLNVFFAERLARLYPLVVFSTIAWLAVAVLNDNNNLSYIFSFNAENVTSLFLSFTMLAGVFEWNATNPPLWSIGVEFLAGLFLFVIWTRDGPTTRIFCAGLAIVIYGYIFAAKGHLRLESVYSPSFHTTFGMLRGVAGTSVGFVLYSVVGSFLTRSLPAHERDPLSSKLLATAFEAGLLFAILRMAMLGPETRADFVSVGLCATLILAFALRKGAISQLLDRPSFGFLGTISFSIYAFHWPLMDLMFRQWMQAHRHSVAKLGDLEKAAILVAVSVTVASMIHFFVERPARAWMRARLNACLAVGTGGLLTPVAKVEAVQIRSRSGE